MNIFIPLLFGILLGYVLKKKNRKVNVGLPMSVALLLLIFFMGVEAGKVEIDALWLLGSSVVFATLTILGSVGIAILLGGKKR
ncbi:hypothetical membrane protein, conserved [Thermococcus onnurineus NA1]|uniref:Hypothetical membrane protein, conserved n=1 Tax=Thermococcus onnurineus (strain NA1) TaxID=523850 RepID=B6YT30_THEON|nr:MULTISPECIES: hypothetical protein [Thermococcus]ACJ15717.1 hypothetical membrane protein, conserved [Thermococcus onnurineus NA1]NJE46211.1 hypothetical protein [Thermococcus sp. GR7]NJE79565.1 hypothetical protein [Thermococcus sp. GR4]NJF23909.1 hypothetical protein [Thermococcus sp. GR5]